MIKIIGIGLSCSVLLLSSCQQQIPNTKSTEPQESESQQQTSNTKSTEPKECKSQKQTPNTNSTEPQTKDKNSHKLGDSIEVGGRIVCIIEVIRDAKIPSENPIGEYVIVRGKITNSSNETGDLLWSNFRLEDSEGRIYQEGDPFSSYRARKKYNAKIPSTDVPPGLSIEFVIVFDITPDATGLKLVWKSGAVDAQEQYVNLEASSYSN